MNTESIPERDDYISRYDIYDLDEQEADHPKKPERNFKKELKEFKKQISTIKFNPLGSREN